MNRFILPGLAAVIVLLTSSPAPAEQIAQAPAATVDVRWLPWIGCWRPADQPTSEASILLCVVPLEANGVRVLTVAGDRTVSVETIIPDGTSRSVDEPTCRGTRRSEWSLDGQRVFSSADLACDKQPARKVSGLSAMTTAAEWIDVQVVTSGAQESVRVRRYQRASETPPDPSLIPPELAARAARSALGTTLTIDHIIEAASKVAPRVLEALLFETKATFPLDSARLMAMDDAGVPDTVIDLMVAFSFPKKFEVRRSTGGFASGVDWGAFGWGGFGAAEYAWPFYYSPYYSYLSPFGYAGGTYGNGYYFYDPGGFAVGAGGGSGGSEIQPTGHGRVVNGSGYTQVMTRPPDNDSAVTQRVKGGDASTGGSGFGGSSSGGSSGGSSGVSSGGYSSGGGGGDSGRTAVPR